MVRGEGYVIMEAEIGMILFEDGERGQMPRWPLEAQKDMETESHLGSSEGIILIDTLTLP